MMKKLSIICLFLAIFVGCAQLDEYVKSDTTAKILTEEAIDTAGYTLGLMAAEKPEFRKMVESYYKDIAIQGLSTALINAGLQQLAREDIAYRVLSYKFARIIRLAGGQTDTDGNITDFGRITMDMLETGKNGYRMALRNTGVVLE
jgi:hypothetical protein